jgi:hypothetical protein
MKNIDLVYIQRLIDDGVSESADIEYKSLIQAGSKRPILTVCTPSV